MKTIYMAKNLTNFYVGRILLEDAFYGYLNERKEEDIKFIVTRLGAHRKILEHDNDSPCKVVSDLPEVAR